MATNPPSDSPDWTGIPGALRYLGTINMTGSGPLVGSLAVAPASYDYSIVVIALGSPASGTGIASVAVHNNLQGFDTDRWHPYQTGSYQSEPFTAFIAAAIPGTWQIDAAIDSAAGSTWQLYVFASPVVPLSRVVANGRGLLVIENGVGSRRPYDQVSTNAPGAAVRSTLTLPAIAGSQWIVDFAAFRLMGRGAADIVLARITDGGVPIYQQRMTVTATVGDKDENIVGPNAGIPISVGAAGVVEFSAAPAAGNFEVTNVGAYLYLPPI